MDKPTKYNDLCLILNDGMMVWPTAEDAEELLTSVNYRYHNGYIIQARKKVNPFDPMPEQCPREPEWHEWWNKAAL